MTAKQTSYVFLWQNTARRLGLIGSCLALMSACSGSIEETEVDLGHQEQGNTGLKQLAAPTSGTGTPARTPAATPPAATPPAATPPAATPPATTPPATTPPATTPPATTPPAAGGDVPSFAADVWPIFSSGCAPCHTGASYGNQDVGDADKATALDDAKRIKTKLVSDLNTGRMPPGCGKPPGGGGGCVSADDFDTVKAWVDGNTPP